MCQLHCCLCRVRKLSDFIKNILICALKMNEGIWRYYRFETTQGWVIIGRIFIFGWTIPFSLKYCKCILIQECLDVYFLRLENAFVIMVSGSFNWIVRLSSYSFHVELLFNNLPHFSKFGLSPESTECKSAFIQPLNVLQEDVMSFEKVSVILLLFELEIWCFFFTTQKKIPCGITYFFAKHWVVG